MNWKQRIERAEKAGKFTADDMARAGKFVTCACAEQDSRILRDVDGAPFDRQLRNLGVTFAINVANNEMARARTTLASIEHRATQVVSEITLK